MTSNPNPTILFVHGAWHSPVHFKAVTQLFEGNGFPTSCPSQPTFGAAPETSMYVDAECINAELRRIVIEEGKDVILVLHSYGGIVGTQAADESFSKVSREKQGLSGGIVQLLYMCAFLLPQGDSLGSAFGGNLPPFITVNEDGSCHMQEPERRFYNDLPKEQQDHWVSELKSHPAKAQLTPLTFVAYKYHPTSYLYCTNDQALPYEVQQMMVGGAGVAIRTYSCSAGHSPFLSQPQAVLDTVNQIIEQTM